MKIRVKLFKHLEVVEEEARRFIEKYPEARKILKMMDDAKKAVKKAYIELETGEEFDELTEKSREALRKQIAEILDRFGGLLIIGIASDVAAGLQGIKERFGTKAIMSGLEEIEEQMEIAVMMAQPSKDNQADH